MQWRGILSSQRKGGHDMKRAAALIAAIALTLSLSACALAPQPPAKDGRSLPVSGMTDRLPRTAVCL